MKQNPPGSKIWVGPYEKIIRYLGKSYFPQIWTNTIEHTTYTHTYQVDSLLLAISGRRTFEIYLPSGRYKLAPSREFTTTPEHLIEGVHHIASLTNWEHMASLPYGSERVQGEMERTRPFLREIYKTFFGTTFVARFADFFGENEEENV